MKNILLVSIIILCSTTINAQDKFTSVIKGNVSDKANEYPIEGAAIIIKNTDPVIGTVTDENGNFKISVPIGMHDVVCTFIGYETVVLEQIRSISGKETFLRISISESFEQLDEVVLKANEKKQVGSANKMSLVSSISFDKELTNRFAGSLSDPSRMVTAFAGVSSADDQRNDINVRGNSSAGILWRLEGMNIPNPNHFASTGNTGGTISIINTNLLAKSDFFISAFLPEYGNVLSGVFDLKLREGNFDKTEATGQIAFAGVEADLEGPFNKKHNSSYLVSYRYSTPEVFSLLGVSITKGALPKYQDLTFKTTFRLNNRNKLSVWGIGGISGIEFLNKDIDLNSRSALTSSLIENSDTYFDSKVGMAGVNYNYFSKNNNRVKLGFLASYSGNKTIIDSIQENKTKERFYSSNNANYKFQLKGEYLKKINTKLNLKTGMFLNVSGVVLEEKIGNIPRDINASNNLRRRFANELFPLKDTDIFGVFSAQAYVQTKYKIKENMSVAGGVNILYFGLNNAVGIDPRINASWNTSPKTQWNFGYGLHHKTQPLIGYYALTRKVNDDGSFTDDFTNKNLKLTRSHHFTTGFTWSILKNLSLKTEVYYQYIDNVPVSKITKNLNSDRDGVYIGSGSYTNPSSYSILNSASSFNVFVPGNLVNNGTGKNYGIEFTLNKALSKGFYFLGTYSLYQSTYVGSNGIEHNTPQNLNYSVNLNTGYEIEVVKKPTATVSLFSDISFTFMGGRPYRNILNNQSEQAGYLIYDDDNIYENRLNSYQNFNFKVGARLNGRKATHLWSFQIKNALNTDNIYARTFSIVDKKVVTKNQFQQKLLPTFTYRINF